MQNAPAVLDDDSAQVLAPDGPSSASETLAVLLTRAEVDQQIVTARAFPRSLAKSLRKMITNATRTEETARECVYAVPRGGKLIRGPSIRFAEIVMNAWGNCRSAARVTHEDRIERFVEAEAVFHDLENNVGYLARTRRTVELKRGKKTLDLDMIRLAGSAAAAIARRNAILGAVGKGVWQEAYDRVEEVIRGDLRTLADRRDLALKTLAGLGVPPERVFKALHVEGLEDITLDHLLDLTAARNSIKGGEATIDELFPEERPPAAKPSSLDQRLDQLASASRGASDTPDQPEAGRAGETAAAADVAVSSSDAEPSPLPKPGGPAGADTGPPSEAVASASPLDAAASTTAPAPERRRPVRERGPSRTPAAQPPDDLLRDAPPEDRRIALQLRVQALGDEVARQGETALTRWLDALTGDEQAVVTIGMTRRWGAAAKVIGMT